MEKWVRGGGVINDSYIFSFLRGSRRIKSVFCSPNRSVVDVESELIVLRSQAPPQDLTKDDDSFLGVLTPT